MKAMRTIWQRLRTDERGGGLVEYALLLALIAIVCIGAITFLGGTLDTRYQSTADCMQVAGTSTPCP